MASATSRNELREVVTRATVTEKVVTLVLTQDEAETLLLLSYYIGGDPEVSRRRHIDAIKKALLAVGVRDIWVPVHPEVDTETNTVYFLSSLDKKGVSS